MLLPLHVSAPLDIANFWVSAVGTAASVVIAGFAVWLSIKTAREAARREARSQREAWARDYALWLDEGVTHMITGGDFIPVDRAWVTTGNGLDARAEVGDWAGAKDFMLAARKGRNHIRTLPVEERVEASQFATRLLKHRAFAWVSTPIPPPDDIVQWIDAGPKAATAVDGLQASITEMLKQLGDLATRTFAVKPDAEMTDKSERPEDSP